MRRNQIGSGDSSERIRTYNFPQNRVTDHRIGLTLYRLEAFLEGDLQEMADALKYGVALSIGVEHPNYKASLEPVSPDTRAALVKDLA